MSEYNRQFYTDRIQTPTPGHQPIYMQVPFNWVANLSTQVAPRDLKAPGTASPLLIGVASKSGAVIESFTAVSLGSVPGIGIGNPYSGGGAGTTSTPAPFGTAISPVQVRFYTRREPDDEIYFIHRFDLFAEAKAPGLAYGRFGYPILPQPELAWRLEPGQEVYVALSQPMPAPGLNFFLFGGHYS